MEQNKSTQELAVDAWKVSEVAALIQQYTFPDMIEEDIEDFTLDIVTSFKQSKPKLWAGDDTFVPAIYILATMSAYHHVHMSLKAPETISDAAIGITIVESLLMILSNSDDALSSEFSQTDISILKHVDNNLQSVLRSLSIGDSK